MARFDWKSEYSVGVKAIDRQHHDLFQSLNVLHEALIAGEAKALAGPLLHKLRERTKTNFTAEEALLAAARYPGLHHHRTMHRKLIDKVEDYCSRFDRGEISLSAHLLNFMRDWLTNHIQKVDHDFGPWLNEHGQA
jgi:hemerythrin